ncbi:MAG TPA: hypothetical protein VJM08_13025 [Anaerolineales bacterium]|nr:hypothetical protein [Anaerolineales bacterium]
MEIRRFDPRLWLGILLVFGGVLALLDAIGVISNAGGIFWGLIFAAGGALFLYMLFNDRENWWAAFPAFTLFGLAAQSFLPDSLEAFDGLVFFAGISLAFWWVYFTDTTRWWAIIPGGVLLTLGATSAVDNLVGDSGGGFFFLGLGLTFLLVAILPGGRGRQWAYIPGVILLVFGALLGTPARGLTEYVWPAILIILGGYFVVRFFMGRSSE